MTKEEKVQKLKEFEGTLLSIYDGKTVENMAEKKLYIDTLCSLRGLIFTVENNAVFSETVMGNIVISGAMSSILETVAHD